MAASVYTFVSVGTSDQNDGAISASNGEFVLGGSGLLTPAELDDLEGEGLQLVAGPATSPSNELTAPTLAAGAAGTLNGAYRYVVTFVTAVGETKAGPEADITVTSQQVDLSNLPVGSATSGVTSRKVYRTIAGGAAGTEKLVTTIADNTTTTYTDNTADGSLGASGPPSVDTSYVTTAPTGNYYGDA